MRQIAKVSLIVSLSLALAGCAGGGNGEAPTNGSQPTKTPDQALVPKAPDEKAVAADPANYDDGFGWIVFKVGTGPTWCTITPETDRVLCEQNEAAATYEQVPPAAGCDGSYGYQVQLWGNKPDSGNYAEFACSSGQFSDPTDAEVLPAGETISKGSITCNVEDVNVRCENKSGQWMALGPAVWSLHN